MKVTRQSILTNLIWRFAERCGAQIVQLIVSIVLARILDPEAYGTISLVLVFSNIVQVFVDSGLGNALIQKKDADDLDFSSVFYFNLVMCIILYLGLFLFAPLIASFYDNPSLTLITRVLCLTVVISGLKNVQQAYISRTMQFKRFFFATLGGTIISAIVGIGMALNGLGVWALVAQKLTNLAIDTLILWLTVAWKPKKMFSLSRLKVLISYGWKLLVSSLIDRVYTDLRSLIIGKLYSEADLAYYNQGRQYPFVLVTNINSAIDSVLFPAMSQEQEYRDSVRNMTRRAIKISTYIMAPLMLGISFCSNSIIQFILTDKWLPCVPFLRIFCITFMFYPIQTANLNAIKAMGRSDLFLKLEIIKKFVGIIVLLSTLWYGVIVMAYSLLVTSVTSQIINSWPNKKLLNYSYIEQLKDILPSILLASFMGVCVWTIEFLHLSVVITLILQIIVGLVVYILFSKLFKLEAFYYIFDIIKSFSLKKKQEG